jgi:predicted ester cyclase
MPPPDEGLRGRLIDTQLIEGDAMSDPAANKALVAEFIAALFTKGELDAVDRYLAPGFVNHDPLPGFPSDREGMRQAAQVFRQAFPDWHAGQEAHIAEGDLVGERFTARGTHQGEIMGASPTWRQVTLAGINIFRVQDGKVVERWGRTDDLGFLQQLGLVPAMTA